MLQVVSMQSFNEFQQQLCPLLKYNTKCVLDKTNKEVTSLCKSYTGVTEIDGGSLFYRYFGHRQTNQWTTCRLLQSTHNFSLQGVYKDCLLESEKIETENKCIIIKNKVYFCVYPLQAGKK